MGYKGCRIGSFKYIYFAIKKRCNGVAKCIFRFNDSCCIYNYHTLIFSRAKNIGTLRIKNRKEE
ncbi:MAG: hypothetical protein NC548_62660 [Lachnospiraceae bacterium]|nr:hypothetical protein [Lachnospiraceae bacterium]